MPEEQDRAQTVADFLEIARQRWKRSSEAENGWRQNSLRAWRFRFGEQWPDVLKAKREGDSEACLVMNKIDPMVKRLVNEGRQQSPQMDIKPIGSGADKKVAQVLEDVIEHIQTRSPSKDAYDHSRECMLTGGIGWFEVCTRYSDIEGREFDQEVAIERIANPFCVYDDPDCTAADHSDAKFRFVIEDLSKAEYNSLWGDSKMASLSEMHSVGDQWPGWSSGEHIRIAKYWHVEEEPYKVWLLKDGTTTREDPGEGKFVNMREAKERKIYWSIINAIEVLEPKNATAANYFGEQFPATASIPVIPVIGDEFVVDGKKLIRGAVENAMDPQRMYNYWCSSATTTIALAPRNPFMMADGQDEGFNKEWDIMNTRNMTRVHYRQVDSDGRPAPPPIRNSTEPPIQAMSELMKFANSDLQDATQQFNPAQGKPSSEAQSGRAIGLLQQQSGIAASGWDVGSERALKLSGRVTLQVVKRIYDAPRIAHIENPDGSTKIVALFNSKITGISPEDAMAQLQARGETQEIHEILDLGAGEYDVIATVGPAFETKRQQQLAAEMSILQVLPNEAPYFADLVIRNMDFEEADDVADRLRKMLPPQLQDMAGDPESKIAALSSQLSAMGQQHQLLMQALQKATQQIQAQTARSASAERIAAMNNAAKVEVAGITAKVDMLTQQAEQDLAAFEMAHNAAHEVGMQAIAPPPVNGQQPNGGQ